MILIVVLGALEVAAVAFLAHRFLPAWLAWLIDAVTVASFLVAVVAVASVLWRRHRVHDDRAVLVLGYLGCITIPRHAVQDVRSLGGLEAARADQTGPQWSNDALLLVAGTGIPRVEVLLDRPIRGRRLWQRRAVTRVEVSDIDAGLADALRTTP